MYENVYWAERIDMDHGFVLRNGGESLHTIIIGDNTYDEGKNGRDIIGDFLGACPKVRSLLVNAPFEMRNLLYRARRIAKNGTRTLRVNRQARAAIDGIFRVKLE